MPPLWRGYLTGISGSERKTALQLLEEIINDGNAALCDDALELAAENGRTDADSVRQCYYMIAKREYRPKPLRLANAPSMDYMPDLSAYDGLTGGQAHG